MKIKSLFLLVFFTTNLYISANDSMFTITSGQVSPIGKNESTIELQQEDLTFYFDKKYFNVQVSYVFYNNGEEINTRIGFPIRLYGQNSGLESLKNENETHITNFITTINGIDTRFEIVKNKPIIIKDHAYETKKIEYWYISDAIFRKNEKTIITVSYTSEYSRGGMGYKEATYLYGTGNTWKNGIENINIRISTNPEMFLFRIESPLYKDQSFIHHWENNESQLFRVNKCNPNVNDEITFLVNDFSWLYYVGCEFQASSQYGNDRLNFSMDVSLLTNKQLRIVRNAFYAVHNYKFKSKDLEDYFSSSIDNYRPQYNNVDTNLTNIQKKAIQIITQEERKRPY